MEIKTCTKCGETKSIKEFRPRSQGRNGHEGQCKRCITAWSRAYRIANAERVYKLKRERVKELNQKRTEKEKAILREKDRLRRRKYVERVKRWKKANRHKLRAYKKVENALANGTLMKESCEVCSAARVHAHHDDYDKPLEVRWLCQPHHAEIHRKYK